MDDNKQKTEEQILIAAEQIFLSKGYAASNIKDIAKLAKVNNALINYYFRSKDATARLENVSASKGITKRKCRKNTWRNAEKYLY